MQKILFVNHQGEKCGVYQYGVHVYRAIQGLKEFSFVYAECSNGEEVIDQINSHSPSLVIYNYHEATMSFVNQSFVKRLYNIAHVCLAHELSQKEIDEVDGSFFDYYLFADPTFIERNPRVFKLRRFLFAYENRFSDPQVPTIGAYGFASIIKEYKELLKLVENEFDVAVLRINISPNSYFDQEGQLAKRIADDLFKSLKKPGITLEVSHCFFTNQELMDFLAQNTINVFMYNPFEFSAMKWGISSAVDQALSVKRPIAITNSYLFRHLFNVKPSIFLKYKKMKLLFQMLRKYELKQFFRMMRNHKKKLRDFLQVLWNSRYFKSNKLKNIIKNGTAPFEKFYLEWSVENFQNDCVQIFSEIIRREEKKSLNRILNNQARIEYQKSIHALFAFSPEEMTRKIPRANVQQGFVFDTVYRLASPQSKILSIGSYEDTACTTLTRLGFQVEGIDPCINFDLNTFFHLPTTKEGSYDIVFATSVIEHVENDELFANQMSRLLAPGGIGVLTCDFKNDWKSGDYIFPGNFRFYTQQTLQEKLLNALVDCQLIGEPEWDCSDHDFEYGGQKYTFATFVFQKNGKPEGSSEKTSLNFCAP